MASFAYTHSPSLAPLTSQSPQSLSAASNPPIDYLMTSVMVLRQLQSQPPQVLLLRRSPTDSYPLKWEPPGGSIDSSDVSVLAAAARELFEETRLVKPRFYTWVAMARDIKPEDIEGLTGWGVEPDDEKARDLEVRIGEGEDDVVRVTTFLETEDVWGKMNFVAAAEGEVNIDPEEHVEWGWFTQDEVRKGRAAASSVNGTGDGVRRSEDDEGEERVLEFTSQAVWGSVLEAFRVGKELGVVA